MPELPEVETVVRDLKALFVGKRFSALWTDWPQMIQDPERQQRGRVNQHAVQALRTGILGARIQDVSRRGKNILFYLSGGNIMLVHQKMTGHFLQGRWAIQNKKAVPQAPEAVVRDPYNQHVHLIFTFTDGTQLGLSDVRKFAKVLFGPARAIEQLPEIAGLGPDALDPRLTVERLQRILEQERRPLKQVLMDPFVIAGIGNIYADDILWRAKIHPRCSARTLTTAEYRALFRALRAVLSKAVRLRGTSTSDFRDIFGREGGYTDHRLVYRRTNEPCARCKTPIVRSVIAGRSAHHCPRCQP